MPPSVYVVSALLCLVSTSGCWEKSKGEKNSHLASPRDQIGGHSQPQNTNSLSGHQGGDSDEISLAIRDKRIINKNRDIYYDIIDDRRMVYSKGEFSSQGSYYIKNRTICLEGDCFEVIWSKSTPESITLCRSIGEHRCFDARLERRL